MRTYAFLLAFFLTLLTLLTLFGCERAQELDNWIWTKTPDSDTIPAADPAPPIVELIASVAALFGYGGLATWIHRSGKNGRKLNAATAADLQALTNEVARLENLLNPVP